ncbi:MAG: hypothetical protein MO846_03555 [Candidatus Devosia symbiotica]|nr:hypothetical protein [Candidatus Devosia symbiotica]
MRFTAWASWPLAMQLNGNFAAHHGYSGFGLAQADDNPANAWKCRKKIVDYVLCDGLKKFYPPGLEGGFDRIIDIGIGNAGAELVRDWDRAQIDTESKVDEESLAELFFLSEDVVIAIKPSSFRMIRSSVYGSALAVIPSLRADYTALPG